MDGYNFKKEMKKVSVDKDVANVEPLYSAVGKVEWYSHCENTGGPFLRRSDKISI